MQIQPYSGISSKAEICGHGCPNIVRLRGQAPTISEAQTSGFRAWMLIVH